MSFGGTPTDRAGESRQQGRSEGSIERVGFQGPLLGRLDMPKTHDVISGALPLQFPDCFLHSPTPQNESWKQLQTTWSNL